MTARKPPALRSVPPADEVAVPEPSKPKSITQAADDGTQLELLVAMRARIARAVDDPKCPPRDLASLTRRLDDIDGKIRALELQAEEEGADADLPGDEAFGSSAI